MKKRLKKLHLRIISFALCIIVLLLSGCEISQSDYDISDKITEEINYLEDRLIDIIDKIILKKYDEQSKLLDDTEKIQRDVNRIMVDLASKNVENSEIKRLSDGINNMILNAENEDIRIYLIEINNIFSLLPNFEAQISDDSDEIFKRMLRYYTVSSFLAFYVGDKELSKTQIETLEKEYLEKQKIVDYVEKNKYNLNKVYLLICELKNAIETDSEELVKEKYLMLIDEI